MMRRERECAVCAGAQCLVYIYINQVNDKQKVVYKKSEKDEIERN
jgi:hypothetical protein